MRGSTKEVHLDIRSISRKLARRKVMTSLSLDLPTGGSSNCDAGRSEPSASRTCRFRVCNLECATEGLITVFCRGSF